jgi:hypothetical protein
MSARENSMSGKKVNDILILTNIAILAAGAAVGDHCTSRLAFVVYRNTLRKYIKTDIFRLKRTTHPSAVLFTEIRGKSDDRVSLSIGFTATTKARCKKGPLQAKTSPSWVRKR